MNTLDIAQAWSVEARDCHTSVLLLEMGNLTLDVTILLFIQRTNIRYQIMHSQGLVSWAWLHIAL